ncbi:hypothetical protein B0H17DRAFT_1263311 [Mycena rosella]|uniref:Uncharacterized protein n=1 Tax=Mycena rosella TaxID=1033263 RepID=A0AAD7CPT7_MYCRO|nr:hypothetical protein B0H17DRAFT_1263311 [Mycena rosella]
MCPDTPDPLQTNGLQGLEISFDGREGDGRAGVCRQMGMLGAAKKIWLSFANMESLRRWSRGAYGHISDSGDRSGAVSASGSSTMENPDSPIVRQLLAIFNNPVFNLNPSHFVKFLYNQHFYALDERELHPDICPAPYRANPSNIVKSVGRVMSPPVAARIMELPSVALPVQQNYDYLVFGVHGKGCSITYLPTYLPMHGNAKGPVGKELLPVVEVKHDSECPWGRGILLNPVSYIFYYFFAKFWPGLHKRPQASIMATNWHQIRDIWPELLPTSSSTEITVVFVPKDVARLLARERLHRAEMTRRGMFWADWGVPWRRGCQTPGSGHNRQGDWAAVDTDYASRMWPLRRFSVIFWPMAACLDSEI